MPRHITDKQRHDILRYHADGHSQNAISKLVGVNRRTVHDHIINASLAVSTATTQPVDPNDPRPKIDIHDDNALASVVEAVMDPSGSARPSEKLQAVATALRVRAESSGGNPAEEPITHEEEARFRKLVWRNRSWFMDVAGVNPETCPICGHEFMEDDDVETRETSPEAKAET